MADNGALVWMVKRGNGRRHYDEIPAEDLFNSNLLGFDASRKSYCAFDSRGRDTSALFAVDAKTKKKRLVYAGERADLGAENHPWPALVHPTEMTVQAVVVDYDKPRWVVLDPRVENDFDAFAELGGGVPTVTSRTLDDAMWIVAFESDAQSTRYYRWDRRAPQGELLFASGPRSTGTPLVPMHAVTIEARDGLQLVSYVACRSTRIQTATETPTDGCRWCCSCRAARKLVIAGGSTSNTNCSPTAATPCSRSTSADPADSARRSPTRAKNSWARRCTTISSPR